ncbi:MAG: hypothetical protein J6E43_01960, partial [Prevotella sp.]|nr:hypothetical protein [Prevotella sp.]
MKKNFFHALLALVMLAATAGLMTSCTSNDDDPTPSGLSEAVVKEKIVGKWELSEVNNRDQVTNGRMILTYNENATLAVSISYFNKETNSYIWRNKQPGIYSIDGNVIKNYLNQSGLYDATPHYIEAISDEAMTMSSTSGGQTIYTRVAADYTSDIIGMWEVTEMTGEETYNDDNARLAFLADGTYRYYRKDDTGDWQLVSTRDVEEYFVDGDWLATRWQETGGEMNYEWWDIDEIKDGQMKWSALREREDGTRFTTTFTWRKVEAPAGVEAVDLGLPSGIKWANMNLGAEAPEDHGLYFAWGETVGIDIESEEERVFDWDSYKWSNGSSTTMTKYCTEGIHYSYDGHEYFGTVDNKTELDPEDDAAYVNWGTEWRMPKVEDIMELLNNTTSEWTMQNGVDGRRFTGANGNSIFLPVTGYIDGV